MRNKFIRGWQATTPTLDPVKPSPDTTVEEEGSLIALPGAVAPIAMTLPAVSGVAEPTVLGSLHVINVDAQLTPADT